MPATALREELTIAGFGGQGIILAGKLLAQTAIRSGKEVTLMPSYGAEVRGGTSNCMIVISDSPIASPVIGFPDSLVAMNKASLGKFGPRIKRGGLLIMNSSLIDEEPRVDGSITVRKVPADEIAQELGSVKVANMVIVGAYLQQRGLISVDVAAECLADVIAKRYHKTLAMNAEALRRGAQAVMQSCG